MIRTILFLLVILSFVSCGKDKLSSSDGSNSSSPASSQNTSCKMINGGSLQGCCSYHGGAKSCSTGMYYFTSSNRLICNDGTVAGETCVGN